MHYRSLIFRKLEVILAVSSSLRAWLYDSPTDQPPFHQPQIVPYRTVPYPCFRIRSLTLFVLIMYKRFVEELRVLVAGDPSSLEILEFIINPIILLYGRIVTK
jgi:hypothetical protein